mmetsp:Transcript_108229/g.233193  ORF Transcript_108229/g.233193 Transcript_108229/m.233193 type:complete len:103 (-) Transcript_108229:129-437(-)
MKTKISEMNLNCCFVHGCMEQKERDSELKRFTKDCNLLITTDILGRGIDIKDIDMVVNYDMPPECELYIHRIGRTGRYQRKGIAINLVITSDLEIIKSLANN